MRYGEDWVLKVNQILLTAASIGAAVTALPAYAATDLTGISINPPVNGFLGTCPSTLALGGSCSLGANQGFESFSIGLSSGAPFIATITGSGFTSVFPNIISFSGVGSPITSASFLDASSGNMFAASNVSLTNGNVRIFLPAASLVNGSIRVQLGTGPIAAVPEPATWAMMLAGLGMIGFAARRRNSVKTTVRFI